MSEDERQQLLGTITEAHDALREAALKLRRHLPAEAPALESAFRAEQEAFRLRREIQRLVIEDPVLVRKQEPLPEDRGSGKVIDIGRLRRRKLDGDET